MKARRFSFSLGPFFVIAILGVAWCPQAARAVGYELVAPNFSESYDSGAGSFTASCRADDLVSVSVADFSVLGDTPVTFTLSAPAGKAFSVDFTGATNGGSMSVTMVPNDIISGFSGGLNMTATFEDLVGAAPTWSSYSSGLYSANILTDMDFDLSHGDAFQFTSMSLNFSVPASYNADLSSTTARDFWNLIEVRGGGFSSNPSGTAFTLVDLAPIPEPSRAVLLGLFGLTMVLRRRR